MKKLVFCITGLFCCWIAAWSQPPIPDPAGRWVIDDAGVLSENTKTTVSSLCQDEFDSTSNQVVVYVFSSLQGSTIEKYANEVFNQWKIGTEENKNGILLMVAVDDHKMRIEVGYGLEPYLTDLEAKDIIDNEIKPNFKQGDFNTGVLKGVQNIIYGIRNSYVASAKPYYESKPYESGLATKNIGIGFWITALCWLGISLWFSRMKMGEGIGAWILFVIFASTAFYVIWYWLYVTLIFVIGLVFQIVLHKLWKPKKYLKFFGSGGGGGSWSSSNSSSYSYTSSYNSGSSYSSGGGGFSGGGGSSGGGGASGDW
jgi:uncharacterized protein